MTIGDFIYAGLVGIAVVVWFTATVLWIDLKLRERKWRKRREARKGYVFDWVPTHNPQQYARLSNLTPTRRTETSD